MESRFTRFCESFDYESIVSAISQVYTTVILNEDFIYQCIRCINYFLRIRYLIINYVMNNKIFMNRMEVNIILPRPFWGDYFIWYIIL